MVLILHMEGATPEALAAGLAAAQPVLNEARITAAEAALAHWARDMWLRNASTSVHLPEGIQEAAAAFALAEAAAIKACCRGRPVPAGARLEVSAGSASGPVPS